MVNAPAWTRERAAELLRSPGPGDDKYRRGVVGLRTGSARYPGAAVLGVEAAWRAGSGMVRYVPGSESPGARSAVPGLPAPAAAVLAARPETVFGTGRCDAWVIGSGTDPALRTAAEAAALRALLRGTAPVVIDAGALDLVRGIGSEHAPLVLTPHAGEFARLAERGAAESGRDSAADGAARDAAVAELAAELGATVLLKGSVTRCASPNGEVLHAGPATPWLASAGTGDVLAGALGALLAQHAEAVRADAALPVRLAATAAVLHDAAARIAAGDPEGRGAGRPITARDVADALPAAWAELVGRVER
ncbi:ADP-dependent NAD(P)H-hydrate dehydratase [Leucobacter allii]|uniref:ADP-dependent NAD(P)H-hydrate dehydratase n=1 Tax=Leucobacter allii TaxID=2932247 RepID=UPI003D29770E